MIWFAGICPYCGMVAVLQSPNLTLSRIWDREMYCPVCFDGRLGGWTPVRADQVDVVYNELRSRWLVKNANKLYKTPTYAPLGRDASHGNQIEIEFRDSPKENRKKGE